MSYLRRFLVAGVLSFMLTSCAQVAEVGTRPAPLFVSTEAYEEVLDFFRSRYSGDQLPFPQEFGQENVVLAPDQRTGIWLMREDSTEMYCMIRLELEPFEHNPIWIHFTLSPRALPLGVTDAMLLSDTEWMQTLNESHLTQYIVQYFEDDRSPPVVVVESEVRPQ